MEQKKIEEFVEKAQQAKSPEELEAAAKACGVELTAEKLAKLEKVLRGKKGELTDEELDGVSGGVEDPSMTDWLAEQLVEQFREQLKDLDPEFLELLKLALSQEERT